MLNKWDTFFLLFMTLPIMGHVVILPLMLDVAGRDAWISILLALPAGVLFAWSILHLRRQVPQQPFSEIAFALFGRWVGRFLLWFLAGYFFFLSVFSLAALGDMTRIAFMPETPMWALLGWFMLFSTYAAFRGLKAIALSAAVLSMIAIITGHTITLVNTPNREFADLLPVFEFGLSPMLWGSVVLGSIWAEMLFLLVIPLQNPHEKRLGLFWVVGVLFNGLMMFFTSTGAIMTFGLGQSDNFVYPALETVRILSLGFIDRFDIYGLILMAFGCYIRISLYLRLSYDLFFPRSIQRKLWRRIVMGLFAFSVLFIGLWMAREHDRLVHIIYDYTYGVILLLLPVLMLTLSWIKTKRRPGAGQNVFSSRSSV